jgi:hypothetical protein
MARSNKAVALERLGKQEVCPAVSRVTASLPNARLRALQDAAASWEKMVWPHGSNLDSNALYGILGFFPLPA